jgi:putative aldouronate transport system substrate-binding protein
MKTQKRVLSLALALVMLLALAACSSGSTDSSGSSAPPQSSSTPASGEADSGGAEREHYTISMYYPLHPSAAMEDIPEGGYIVDNEYKEMFNVDFDVTYVPAASEQEVYNVTMASGDIPDVVAQRSGTTGGWLSLNRYKEAWKPLNSFIQGKYPYLEEVFYNDPYVYALSAGEDGEIKILSMVAEQYFGDVLLIRGDLVEEWGIDISQHTTKEGFADLLRISKKNAPEIVPYMTRRFVDGLVSHLAEGWSGIRMYEMVDAAEDKVVYGSATPKMKEVTEWLRGLYAEGLVDAEFPTTDAAAWQQNILNNGVFVTMDNASSRIRWATDEWALLGVTDKYYQAFPPLDPDENTQGTITFHYPKLRDSFAVSAAAEDGKVDRIMEIANYNFSPDGFERLTYGVKDVSFTIDAQGLYQHVPEYHEKALADTLLPEENVTAAGIPHLLGRLEPNGATSIDNRDNQLVQDAVEMYEGGGLIRNNLTEAIRFTDEEQDEVNQMKADLKTYTDENISQFITGVKSMDGWDAFIEGYQNIGIGLDRYLEIYNTAYDRARELLNR